MTKATVEVINETGLHARPASIFSKTAMKFESEIVIEKDGIKKNAKSILNVLTLGVKKGSIITIEAQGNDQEIAISTLVDLIRSGFGE